MFMRKLSVVITLCIISISASAQTATSNDLARKLLQVTGSGEIGVQMINMMIEGYKKNLPDVPTEFWDKFKAEVKADEIVDLVVPIYVKYYSAEDMTKLIEFFKTPLGQKYISKMPMISQESYMVGEQWGKKLGERVVKKLEDEGYLKED